MSTSTNSRVVFFDIGGVLATARHSPAGALIGFDADPTVFSILERLSGSTNLRLGVISNTGSEARSALDTALGNSGLGRFFPAELRIYSSDVPVRRPPILPKPDLSIFHYAAQASGVTTAECLFVGDSADERRAARQAGMQIAPHPAVVEEVLEGIPLRYVRISPRRRADDADEQWREVLATRIVPLAVFGHGGHEVIAIAGARTAAELDDLGFLVTRLGSPNAPQETEVYLLRDDIQLSSGFLQQEGNSAQFFGKALLDDERTASLADEHQGEPINSESPWDWVLASNSQGLLVALPAGYSVEQFHFDKTYHGHNLKLIPSPRKLKPFGRPATTGFKAAGWLVTAGEAERDLTAAELEAVQSVDDALIQRHLDSYAGLADFQAGSNRVVSRHIRHNDNSRVTHALAAQFEALGLQTSLQTFSLGSLALNNVEAVLPGTTSESILITAHLDSTAKEGTPDYHPTQDPAPGADDDCSGVAAVLALAEVLAKFAKGRAFQRTLRFVLFNAEEQGLVGSQHFAAMAAARDESIVAVLQMDMIGYVGANTAPRPFEVHLGHARTEVTATSRRLADLIVRLQPAVAPDLLTPQIYPDDPATDDPEGDDPAAGRSDHASFQDHGYPACVLSEDFFSGPRSNSPEPQENPNYHKPSDNSVNYGYVAQIARCVGAAALILAEPAGDTLNSIGDVPAAKVPGKPTTNFKRSEKAMSLDFDVREAARPQISAEQLNAKVDNFAQLLATDGSLRGRTGRSPQVQWGNALTGTPRKIVLERPVNLAAAASDRIDQALELARRVLLSSSDQAPTAAGSRGIDQLTESAGLEFAPDTVIQSTSGNAETVYLNQMYRGIPIYHMSRTVQFAPSGAIELTGDNISAIPSSFKTVALVPALAGLHVALERLAHDHATATVDDHYTRKAQKLEPVDPERLNPKLEASFDGPARSAVFSVSESEFKIPAQLNVILAGPDTFRLAWNYLITLPSGLKQYRILVSADSETPEVLIVKEKHSHARPSGAMTATPTGQTGAAPTSAPASGNVFFFHPVGDTDNRRTVDFPLAAGVYPFDPTTAPAGFPMAWTVTGSANAVGPNVIAVKGNLRPSDPGALLSGTQIGKAVQFSPTSSVGDDQKLLNIFFFCNYLHDFFQLLGFTKEAGNFEGDDAVLARAHPGTVSGTANMLTLPDGQRPIMNMGLVRLSPTRSRHTAMDADVVFHEYAHGVSNRLVGGPVNTQAMESDQSGSIGEGASDYFALTIQNFFESTERTTTGDWVVDQEGEGIRNHPYDENYPNTFGSMASDPEMQEVHNAGEIWCAALMSMTRRMVAALGSKERAYRESWQVVIDSFKTSPANPGFLDARDEILKAIDNRRTSGALTPQQHTACRRATWEAFARWGMGANAVNTGNTFEDAQDDFHLPIDLSGTVVDRPTALVSASDEYDPGNWTNPAHTVGEPSPKDLELQKVIALWEGLSERQKGRAFELLEQFVSESSGVGPAQTNLNQSITASQGIQNY